MKKTDFTFKIDLLCSDNRRHERFIAAKDQATANSNALELAAQLKSLTNKEFKVVSVKID